eukprot:GHVN01066411.1.p1 GENE.GHVN01066411.1~~GHVN01066411.1.p1  ORF type:complete len:342 (-),score=45.77 GHVN01066411.1:155-1180(-)
MSDKKDKKVSPQLSAAADVVSKASSNVVTEKSSQEASSSKPTRAKKRGINDAGVVKETGDDEEKKGLLEQIANPMREAAKEHFPQLAAKIGEKGIPAFMDAFTSLKNQTLDSPALFRGITIGAATIMAAHGALGVLGSAITLSPIHVLHGIMTTLLGLVIIAAEVARMTAKHGLRRFVRNWARFLEKCFGRGVVQILAATFPLCDNESRGFVVGGTMMFVGSINMLYGWRAGKKLQDCMAELQDGLDGLNNPARELKMMQNKFKALDLNGDGHLTRMELEYAVQELNLPMSKWEMDAAFGTLSEDKEYLNLDDFARWWFGKKNASEEDDLVQKAGKDFSVV